MPQLTISATAGSSGINASTGGGGTWVSARALSSGTLTNFIIRANKIAADNFGIARGFLNFTIPDALSGGSAITSATLIHPAIANNANLDGITIDIVASTASDPVATTNLGAVTVNGDTVLGSVAMSGLSTSSTTNVSLNASGLALIKTAVDARAQIKLALRSNLDVTNTAPSSNGNEYTVTVANFQLTIDYLPPGGAGIVALM